MKIIYLTFFMTATQFVFHEVSALFLLKNARVNVTLGKEFTFYCLGPGQHGGIWLLRNDETVYKEKYICNTLGVSSYDINCYELSPQTLSLVVRIPAVNMTTEQHGSKWICTGWNDNVQDRKYLTLDVQVPALEINISHFAQISQNTTDMIEVTCEIDCVRPPANIDWFIEGKKLDDVSRIKTSVQFDGNGLYNTKSTWKFQHEMWNHYRFIYCEGWNIPDMHRLRSQIVDAEKTDETPQIEGYSSGCRLQVTDPPLQLVCRVSKNTPRPELHWVCPGYSVHGRITYTDFQILNKIDITVKENLNGKTCWCIVRNWSFEKYNSVTFRVSGIGSNSHSETNGEVFSIIQVLLYVILSTHRFSCLS